MIEFIKFNDNKTGIEFTSSFSKKKNITVLVSDGYSGLNLWKGKMQIDPNINYHFSSNIFSAEKQFEIYDEYEIEKLFSIFIKMDDHPSIEKKDKLGVLKSYNYDSFEQGAGLPIFEIFLNREYEHENIKVQEGDIVFDIGANIGIFSLYSLYKSAKEVHSFEPGKKQFEAIKNNLSTFDNLYVNNLAVTKNKGTTKFYTNESSVTNSTFFKTSEKYVEVNTIDINSYINDSLISKIDYLKIDCEGGEYEIIESLDEHFLKEKINKICLEYHILDISDNLKLEKLVNKLNRCNFKVHRKNTMLYCKNINVD
jgi:FkbM family methyltransferase